MALRFVQGFALGGEWGGAVLLVGEHSPDRSRAFWSSFPQAGLPLGNLVATIVLLGLSSFLSPEHFLSWGWRAAFWVSASPGRSNRPIRHPESSRRAMTQLRRAEIPRGVGSWATGTR